MPMVMSRPKSTKAGLSKGEGYNAGRYVYASSIACAAEVACYGQDAGDAGG
jgi:hypothetical protein